MSEETEISLNAASQAYTEDVVEAVHQFRVDQGLWTPRGDVARGLVDQQTIDRLWQSVEAAGKQWRFERSFETPSWLDVNSSELGHLS